MKPSPWQKLDQRVIACQRCPRLTQHCQAVAGQRRRAYQDQEYWGRPVPNLGRPPVQLLVIGLAPGAHGANRTGRMFTGDRSGEWLYRALHQYGFANQPDSQGPGDGLELIDAAITNIARCAPPQNRPTAKELENCSPFFLETLKLARPRVLLALGGLAWRATLDGLAESGQWERPRRLPAFRHGAQLAIDDSRTLLGSYHPSQQNTFTGRLTRRMFHAVFRRARQLVEAGSRPQ